MADYLFMRNDRRSYKKGEFVEIKETGQVGPIGPDSPFGLVRTDEALVDVAHMAVPVKDGDEKIVHRSRWFFNVDGLSSGDKSRLDSTKQLTRKTAAWMSALCVDRTA